MQINVGLPSRGRPLEMVGAVVSLFRMSSGTNDVTVTIACDRDDSVTRTYADELGALWQVQVLCEDRPTGLGRLHNKMALMTPAHGAFMLWSDRVMMTAPNWDVEMAEACLRYPNRPLWLDSVHLVGAGQFILPWSWRKVAGDACPGLYPFWFEDTHVEEMDAFVHGFPRVALASKGAGPRGAKTTRCRDVAFWIELFALMRDDRIKQAEAIREKLHMPSRDMSNERAYFEQRDRDFLARAPELEKQYGAVGPADESYMRAKHEARKIMAKFKVRIAA